MGSSDELDEATDYFSATNNSEVVLSDEESSSGREESVVAESIHQSAGDSRDDEEMIEISSRTHGVDHPQPMHFTVQGHVADGNGGVRQQNVEVSVVSLERYTFVDPVAAAAGPEPLDPPVQQTLMGVDALQLRGERSATGSRRMRGHTPVYDAFDEDRVCEFTEESSNRRLSRIARQLLLPNSYVEACYDLHEFMETEPEWLAVETVQRNVFKCLKICARLSKLHGYSIQHMWQVIQQAHKRVNEFTPPRARTVELWNAKLTNRIRMMAVSPASDGSAPQRLPSMPPPELLNAQAREKLLPLPEINVAALNDRRFDRAAGASSASFYLANPLMQQQRAIQSLTLPPISELQTMTSSLPPPLPLAPPQAQGSSDSPEDDQHSEYSVEEPGSDIFSLSSQQQSTNESLASTREAELAIIEHQLRELERIPPQRLGPMMRAALNLLVEMRFRLQLGLPRSAIAAAESRLAPPVQLQGVDSAAGGAFGNGALSEERAIEYVLDQISTTRRMHNAQMLDANGESTALTTTDANGYGAPLYMLPHHAGMFYPDVANAQSRSAYRAQAALQADDTQQLPLSVPRSDLRRRRDADDSSESEPVSDAGFDADGDIEVDDSDDDHPMSFTHSPTNSIRRSANIPRRRNPRRRRRE
ncbi:hypothetical protein H4R24_005435 [Coemansia sp. RSA 988]|nr:hypothetical protein H4R24_005435 [Coemansia sp. RSA 988]